MGESTRRYELNLRLYSPYTGGFLKQTLTFAEAAYQTLCLIFLDNGLDYYLPLMGISIVCSFEALLFLEQKFERADA